MQYNKPTLTFDEQANLLLKRGLIADKNKLIECLKNVNYYRLSGYLYPYRLTDDKFKPNTKFDDVWQIYRFDRLFRLIILDAIERVEVSIRTHLTYSFSRKFGSFFYTEKKYFPNFRNPSDHDKWIQDIEKDIQQSKEEFVKHFQDNYGDCHSHPPLWVTSEVLSFGRILTMYKGAHDIIRKEIATYFKVDDVVLESWLRSINSVRNIAAHHSRLWNRMLGYKPLLPKANKHPQWCNKECVLKNDRMFIIVLILRHMLRICAPQSKWYKRLEKHFENFPLISLYSMGFSKDWKSHPIWRELSPPPAI